MANKVAKATTLKLALGNKLKVSPLRTTSKGFTLIELLVVISIMAIALGAVSLSMRTDTSQLEREAQRLSAQLDGAKAASRAMGVPVFWSLSENGYKFEGIPKDELSKEQAWMTQGVSAQSLTGKIVLGPEPVLPPQSIVLSLGEQKIRIASNGVQPFQVVPLDADISANNTP